jgi:acyl CoA:acetate/3-ketoacid CoA transferase
MQKKKTASEAAALVDTGDTVLIMGSGGGLMDADRVFEALEDRFRSSAATGPGGPPR